MYPVFEVYVPFSELERRSSSLQVDGDVHRVIVRKSDWRSSLLHTHKVIKSFELMSH